MYGCKHAWAAVYTGKDQECEHQAKLTARAVTALLHAAQCDTEALIFTKHLKTSYENACDKSEHANK